MICPHCSASINYKERNYETCSKCYKEFAFEPKTHPLQLSDNYFSRTADKLSSSNRYFFTKDQLRFAVSRKRLRSSGAMVVIVILAIVSSIIVGVAFYPALLAVIPFWIIVIIAKMFYSKRNVSLPQTAADFEYTVLDRWLRIYKKYPNHLITEVVIPNNFHDNLRGTLICEDNETALCLYKNHLGEYLKVAIISSQKALAELPARLRELPVYVLHDASIEGYLFLEKIRQELGRQAKVIDIGFRPRAVMKSKLMQLRQPNAGKVKIDGLTGEELNWLNQGFHVPTFVLKPEKLINYVKKQIGQKPIAAQPENAEEKAKAVGFMTWVNE